MPKKIIPLLFLLPLLSAIGCAEQVRFDPMPPNIISGQIIIGKTTRSDIIAQFGQPTDVDAGAKGREVFKYLSRTYRYHLTLQTPPAEPVQVYKDYMYITIEKSKVTDVH
jgi:hypothetical protein